MRRFTLMSLVLPLLAPSMAHADYSFILPSSTNLSSDNATVTFDAAGSDHLFYFDHRPLQLTSIRIYRPDGTAAEPVNTLQARFRSVFDLKLDQQGTWKVESSQSMVTGTFRLNGEERRVGGRGAGGGPGSGNREAGRPDAARPRPDGAAPRPEGAMGDDQRRLPPIALQDIPAEATDVHLSQVIRTTATFVTAGAPTTGVFKPQGSGLEFDPITHPNTLAAGETARFRFLIDGKPAAGLKVTIVPGGDRYRDDSRTMELTTARDGTIAVTWPTAGMYWLGVDAEDAKPSEKRAESRKMSYAATLEVMTP